MKPSKFYISIIFIIFIIPLCNGQDWPKIYGDYFDSYVNNVIEDYDLGYLLGGSVLANPNTFKYAWIIKVDINGNELWNKKFGDGNLQYYLNDFKKDESQGVIICGATTLEDSWFDPLFLKLNACYEPEWCNILLSEGYNVAGDIISVYDGYIGLLTHYGEDSLYSNISLIKLNLQGEPIWIQSLAQEDTLINNEEGRYLYLTNDSNYLISGEAYHPGYHPFWILTDTLGIQKWDLFWNSLVGQAHQLVEKDTGTIYSTCWGIAPGMPQSPVLLKFDLYGNPIDMYYLMGDSIGAGSASPIAVYSDSSLIIGVAWETNSYPVQGYSEVFLTDTLGNIYNRRILLNDFKNAKRVIKTLENKIIVTGNYVVDDNWDIYLWKMNANLEDDTLYTQPLTYDSLCPYEIQSDTVDLDCDLFVNIDELPTKEEYESTVKISPNPARDWVALTLPDVVAAGKVEVVVYDVFGREVGKGRKGDGENGRRGEEGKGGSRDVPVNRMVVMDVSGYPPGMYVVVVTDQKGRRYSGKMIVR